MAAPRWKLSPWLAPPAAVLLVLAAGSLLVPDPGPEPPPPPPPLAAASDLPRPRELAVPLRRSDGSPAEGALVVLLRPEPAVARADREGLARLQVFGGGPYELWAHLGGCALLRPGPFEEPPADGWTFAPLEPPELSPRSPQPVADLQLRLRTQNGPAVAASLAGSLVLARADGEADIPPALAIAAEDGAVLLRGLADCGHRITVYAPGLPPDPAWALASRTVSPREAPAGGVLDWTIPAATIQLRGLPALEILDGERLDLGGRLALRLVPPSGDVDLGPLPPGRYRFRVRETVLEAEVRAGPNDVAWTSGAG